MKNEFTPKDGPHYIVEMSDAFLCREPLGKITTYALGSCLGVAVYDAKLQLGGVLHALLPWSQTQVEKAQQNPYMFVDSGVVKFFNRYFSLGGSKEDMIVKVVGCAKLLQDATSQNIGQQNYEVAQLFFQKNNIVVAAEWVGGFEAKTMTLDLDTGTVYVKAGDVTKVL